MKWMTGCHSKYIFFNCKGFRRNYEIIKLKGINKIVKNCVSMCCVSSCLFNFSWNTTTGDNGLKFEHKLYFAKCLFRFISCDASCSRNSFQFHFKCWYFFKLKSIKQKNTLKIHTEQTCGMWTRTPPTECGSGCGTAIGTGPTFYIRNENTKKNSQ